MADKFIVLCFVIGIATLPLVHSEPKFSLIYKVKDLQDLVVKLGHISTLEYGDSCHSEDIKITETVLQGLEAVPKIDESSLASLESELDKINENIRAFLSTGYKVCNGKKLLWCDESTKLCNCGPKRLSNRDFSYIRNSNGECFWAKDSPCFPTNGVNLCANNTKCAFSIFDFDSVGIACEHPNVLKHVTTNTEEIVQKCYCKSTESDRYSNPQSSSSANTKTKYLNTFFYNSVYVALVIVYMVFGSLHF